jgi:hypothetical protein
VGAARFASGDVGAVRRPVVGVVGAVVGARGGLQVATSVSSGMGRLVAPEASGVCGWIDRPRRKGSLMWVSR